MSEVTQWPVRWDLLLLSQKLFFDDLSARLDHRDNIYYKH